MLRDLAPFALKPATLALLHGCFLRFLNCTYSTKLHNASHKGTNQLIVIANHLACSNIKYWLT